MLIFLYNISLSLYSVFNFTRLSTQCNITISFSLNNELFKMYFLNFWEEILTNPIFFLITTDAVFSLIRLVPQWSSIRDRAFRLLVIYILSYQLVAENVTCRMQKGNIPILITFELREQKTNPHWVIVWTKEVFPINH